MTRLDLSLDPNGHAVQPTYDPPTNGPGQPNFEGGDDYIRNIPVGRTFGTVLGAAAGSQDDGIGITISGGTSLENTYVVDENSF